MAVPTDDSPRRRGRVEPIYRPLGESGDIILYAGDLAIQTCDEERVVPGQLELRLFPQSHLSAHFVGPASVIGPISFNSHGDEPSVSVPDGRDLTPPLEPSLPERPDRGGWGEDQIALPRLEAGDVGSAERFIIHFSQSVQRPRFRVLERLGDGSRQGQVSFELNGWKLVMASVDDPTSEFDFGAVAEATPIMRPLVPGRGRRTRR